MVAPMPSTAPHLCGLRRGPQNQPRMPPKTVGRKILNALTRPKFLSMAMMSGRQ